MDSALLYLQRKKHRQSRSDWLEGIKQKERGRFITSLGATHMTSQLFREKELRIILSERESKMLQEVERHDRDYLLNVNVDDLSNYLEQAYRLEPIILKVDEIQVSHGDTQIDVSRDQNRYISDRSRPFFIAGTYIGYAIPFDGDKDLFRYQPNSRVMKIFTGRVYDNELHLTYTRTDHNAEAVGRQFKNDLHHLQQQIGWVNQDVNQFNAKLLNTARDKITSRREKFLKDQGMAEALGFPLKQRGNALNTYTVPIVRKQVAIQRPTAPTQPYKPEPALEAQQYETILNIISHMVTVMERSPKSFIKMKEEDLRQHFLVQLNGQFDGQATGETFNFEGKTDILIRTEGRNLFIAECKFWKGEKQLLEAINQLLGYLSWRDSKTALILFNRTKNLSEVLSKIPSAIASHPNFKKQIKYQSETGFRFVLHQNGDSNRELLLSRTEKVL